MAVCSIRSSPAETIGGHHDRTRQTSSATLGDSRLRPVARIQHSVSEPDRADPADRRVLQVIEPGLARPDRGDLLAARAGCAASQLRLGADRRADQRGVRHAGSMGVRALSLLRQALIRFSDRSAVCAAAGGRRYPAAAAVFLTPLIRTVSGMTLPN